MRTLGTRTHTHVHSCFELVTPDAVQSYKHNNKSRFPAHDEPGTCKSCSCLEKFCSFWSEHNNDITTIAAVIVVLVQTLSSLLHLPAILRSFQPIWAN